MAWRTTVMRVTLGTIAAVWILFGTPLFVIGSEFEATVVDLSPSDMENHMLNQFVRYVGMYMIGLGLVNLTITLWVSGLKSLRGCLVGNIFTLILPFVNWFLMIQKDPVLKLQFPPFWEEMWPFVLAEVISVAVFLITLGREAKNKTKSD
eukprot:TRINITY_DN12518_c0_g1_i1.p1 TRINITY_DN12518_c0_g1~~TRINITY_DN12518_c0_g1_i1.p1  ORF type:complete len:150 (+),score=8.44 TRINITY_DN12518_c0_g1_i1:23-472(+)